MTKISFDIDAQGQKYNQFWKKLICAGRAAEGLREDWRKQLREVQNEIGFEYIRFHGIFNEDMMIYNEDNSGRVFYNWQYADNLLDFLREVNICPIIELGFMPYKLASAETYCFWWKGNTSPPKDYEKWAGLVRAFAVHFIDRYGIEEVRNWYFEVWNEANGGSGFWTGTEEEYLKLYEYSVKAIKSIDKKLKVGGPASTPHLPDGVAPFIEDFIKFCEKNKLPVDFVSTHPYPNHWPKDDIGNYITMYKHKDYLNTDLKWLRTFINNSPYKDAEIHLTEWNSSPGSRDLIHDTAFMAPFIAYNYIRNIGIVDSLGFWVFSDVFEEGRAGDTIFHGGFGLINVQGLKKPAYYGFWFLSKLGDEKLTSNEDYIVCRKGDKIQILMWNYCHYKKSFCEGDFSALTQLERYSIYEENDDLEFEISIGGFNGNYKVIEYVLDRENGSVFDAWLNHGMIENPTNEELTILRKKMGPNAQISILRNVKDFSKKVSIKPHGICMIEIQKLYDCGN